MSETFVYSFLFVLFLLTLGMGIYLFYDIRSGNYRKLLTPKNDPKSHNPAPDPHQKIADTLKPAPTEEPVT